jgi:hypothetical protein
MPASTSARTPREEEVQDVNPVDVEWSSAPQEKRRRWGEPWKFVPVLFVVFTITCLYVLYVFYHLLPMYQWGVDAKLVNEEMRTRCYVQCGFFHFFTLLLLICYVRSILVHPGEIPENDPQWDYVAQDGNYIVLPSSVQEVKKSGERRHCKWCGKYKPDRCHHCRVCKTCILKMDHHCPWIYNCVGFANYKDFFLLLVYTALDCHLIVWTMLESVLRAFTSPQMSLLAMFGTFFGEALAFFVGVLVTMFLGFHIYLMINARTTIEFCEKSLPKKPEKVEKAAAADGASPYDLGFWGNLRVILGDRPCLWLVPAFSQPSGDGVNFVSEETRLTTSMDGAGPRRKTHQRTQRVSQHRGGIYEDDRSGHGDYGNYGAAGQYDMSSNPDERQAHEGYDTPPQDKEEYSGGIFGSSKKSGS